MSSTINDLKTPSSGGGVALDYANPVHTFANNNLSYTVPNDGNSYYLCGIFYRPSSGGANVLRIDDINIATASYYSSGPYYAPFINCLRVSAGQTVQIIGNDIGSYLHIFKAL